ncbi:unnamed protein product [Brachionus calyciflorus]|uniref:Uncharacterized protein n=1 Tax=Brachionus calyciflorus TaxID=104777 RepID=A0A814DSQ1_9BILA|nr:unnamed protein product [Brachionus calyciflorus]
MKSNVLKIQILILSLVKFAAFLVLNQNFVLLKYNQNGMTNLKDVMTKIIECDSQTKGLNRILKCSKNPSCLGFVQKNNTCILISTNDLNDIKNEYFQMIDQNQNKLINCIANGNNLNSESVSVKMERSNLNLASRNTCYIEPYTFQYSSQLTTLNLSNSFIDTLPSKALFNLNNLTFFNMSFNYIRDIELGTFNSTKNLVTLHLTGNLLNSLKRGTFEGLVKLKNLYLNRNNISFIENGTLDSLNELLILDLSINSIRVITGLFDSLKRINQLYLNINRISSIEPGSFNFSTNLVTLYLSQNFISDLKGEAFVGLSKLKNLYLNRNNISYIENGTFDCLNELIILNLSNNSIRLITNLFDNLKKLDQLYLNTNRISLIETNTFSNLSKLRILNLDDNSLTNLPNSTFDGLINIRTLRLSINRINFLPSNIFNNLKSLSNLNIARNSLSFLNNDSFKNLSELATLDLSYNRLKSVDLDDQIKLNVLHLTSNLFEYFSKNLTKLTTLSVARNPLRYLNYSFLNEENSSLQYLYLHNCQLSSIDSNSFQYYRKLINITLEGNDFIYLNESLFDGLEYLKMIRVSSNVRNLPDLRSNFKNLTILSV